MRNLHAKEQGRHSILVLNNIVEHRIICNVEEALPQVFEQFIALHNHVFSNTYYDGNEIIERLSNTNKLFVSMKNDKLEGYVYVEVNPSFKKRISNLLQPLKIVEEKVSESGYYKRQFSILFPSKE